MEIIKYLIIGGTLWGITKLLLGYLYHIKSLPEKKIQILSDDTSKHVLDCLNEFQNESLSAVKELNDLVKEHDERFLKEMKKIVSQNTSEDK